MSATAYETFLESKRLVVRAQGPAIEAGDIHPTLFGFQRDLVRWSVRKGRCAIFADTGLGKSRMQIEWARLIGGRSLIVAPLSVARQTVREAALIDVHIHYTRSGDDLSDGINITNYEMLSHFDANAFGSVVLDECFAPDTPIDVQGEGGGCLIRKPISSVKVGDLIYNPSGVDAVSDVHRREVQYAVKVNVGWLSVTCSPNHPWFTQRGWIGAQDLEPGDSIMGVGSAMRLVRGVVQPEESRRAVLREILLSEMADAPTGDCGEGPLTGSGREARTEPERVVGVGQSESGSRTGTHPRPQSDVEPGDAGEVLPRLESDEPQTFRAWGQRAGLDGASVDADGCVGRGMGSGVCLVTGPTDSRLSDALQARLGESRAQSRYRGGWTLASLPEGTGPEEGCEAGFARVEGIEVLEPGHPDLEKHRDADGRIYFYDLGATRHPSFSVFGYLVHNSSILKSLDGKTRQRLTEMFEATPYRLCCTATPAPNDIAEIANHAEFLGIMTRTEMMASFFVHDDEGWRLKRPAQEPFYRWLASWGMSIRKPSDLGYPDDGYDLPPLSIKPVFVDTEFTPTDSLFFTGLKGITDRSRVRKGTITERVNACVSLVNAETFGYNLGYEPRQTASEVRVHETLERGEQGAREGVPSTRGCQGAAERSEAGAVCPGPGAQGANKRSVAGLAKKQPGDSQESTIEAVRHQHGGLQGVDGDSERAVRDLRTLGPVEAEHLSACGSLPQNGQGARPSVPQLQSGDREIQGRPGPDVSGGGLHTDQWIIWCGLNAEQDAIAAALGDDCVSVYGSLPFQEKERLLDKWLAGEVRILVSKPSVLGFGLNLQNARKMAFVGLSDSWEAYYQCVRRCWRFGQTRPVEAYIVLSEPERPIYENVMRKEEEATKMADSLIQHVAAFEREEIGEGGPTFDYHTDTVRALDYTAMLGDSVERLAEVESDSVGLSVFSPPFMSLYTYSPTERDLGNCKGEDQFFHHFGYIIDHLLRVTMPGRLCCVHVAQVPAMLARDGYIGLKDFRGATINAFVDHGWIHHGEVCIDKDPQAQAIRTKSKSLLFTQLHKDSSWSRPALADFILVFRKPGENKQAVHPDITNDEWIEWARPIWYNIRESDTLQYSSARGEEDERHICPLQLGTIERCVKLWSNEGDLVCDPFGGIGSTGWVALRNGRRAVTCELKPSYYQMLVRNLREAANSVQPSLFDEAAL